MHMKKYSSGVLAAAMGIGVLIGSVGSAEAAPVPQPLAYENGASNEYSFRMKEEDRIHEENVRKIRFDFQRDGDQAKYNRAMKDEQKRHDRAVQNIKKDYKNNKPWRR